MRRIHTIALTTLLLLVTAVPAGPQARAAPGPAVLDDGQPSPCIPEVDKQANPRAVLKGEHVRITLRSTVLCASETFPLRVVLVLDGSTSMQGTPVRQMKQAAVQLVQDLNLPDNPQTEVGVVVFNDRGRTLTDLTNDEKQVISAIQRVRANGNTRIDEGIKEGLKVLLRRRGKGGLGAGGQANEVMVVLSDGQNNAGCAPVLQAARQAKGQDVLVITICVGPDCDADCMRRAASSPHYFYQVQNTGQLKEVFRTIQGLLRQIVLKRLTITDVLPDNMRYIPNSAEPEPYEISPNGDLLTWQTNYVPTQGVTFTFEVEPLQTGYHPTNVEARGDFKDSLNREGSFVFQVPWVMVLQPQPVATPTVPGPTATYTPTSTPGPSSTPTPTPTASPTPRPKPVFLPIAVWHPCIDEHYYSDVALVLDVSTSMNWPTRTGRSKLDASIAQAKRFVDQMSFTPDQRGGHDQVAIVGFNRTAWIEQELTADRRAIHAALDRLPLRQEQFTRLDLAIERGAEVLQGPNRRPANTRVIILLTDGLPNQVPYAADGTMETTVLQRATDAKQEGIRIYTIGIGAPGEIDPGLLRRIASDPSLYYYEPDPEDLSRVYSEIVGTFGCPRSRYEWPGPWPAYGQETP